jgi:hypothetical protein
MPGTGRGRSSTISSTVLSHGLWAASHSDDHANKWVFIDVAGRFTVSPGAIQLARSLGLTSGLRNATLYNESAHTKVQQCSSGAYKCLVLQPLFSLP